MKQLIVFLSFVMLPMMVMGGGDISVEFNKIVTQTLPAIEERVRQSDPILVESVKNGSDAQKVIKYNNFLAVKEFENVKSDFEKKIKEKHKLTGREIIKKGDKTEYAMMLEGSEHPCLDGDGRYQGCSLDNYEPYRMLVQDHGTEYKSIVVQIADKKDNVGLLRDFALSNESWDDANIFIVVSDIDKTDYDSFINDEKNESSKHEINSVILDVSEFVIKKHDK